MRVSADPIRRAAAADVAPYPCRPVAPEVDRPEEEEEQIGHDVFVRWVEAMRRGDFEEAWRQTDRVEIPRRRRQSEPGFIPGKSALLWDGTPFEGRRVVIHCLDGLGDTLHFIRYVPLISAVAKSVTVLAQESLVELLSAEPAFGHVLSTRSAAAAEAFDVTINIMELAYAFRSTLQTLPNVVPYLPLNDIRSKAQVLPERLCRCQKLRVGLVWAAGERDPTRSIPLRDLEPLSHVRGVEFFSLQQGPRAAEADSAPFRLEPLSRWTADPIDASAAMVELDLVITVDSMPAHLAGALGRPVWVLLLENPDWRWMREVSHTPWYPSMRLFRQPRPGDWHSVIEQVRLQLEQLVAGTAMSSASAGVRPGSK